ncbi:MAG: carboxypeptidase-like regulatory domain-containing protein [Actinomycetota bacterium]|nr:carboxypeptidase-like regulatory domain-containing protein [Actinomycetota bacterium]
MGRGPRIAAAAALSLIACAALPASPAIAGASSAPARHDLGGIARVLGQASGADRPGEIVGRAVRAGHSGLGAAARHVCVLAYPAVGPVAGRGVTSEVTARSGRFLLGPLSPGQWDVLFRPCGSGFAFEPTRYEGGLAVPVAAGRLTPLRTVALEPIIALGGRTGLRRLEALMGTASGLGPGRPDRSRSAGSISGTVSAPDHKPLAGICVDTFGYENGRPAGQSVTAKNGRYHLRGVPPGRFAVGFTPDCGSTGLYLPVFYGGSPNPPGRAVVVRAGQETTGIDAVMPLGTEVSGTVKDVSGRLLDGTCATAMTSGPNFALAVEEPVAGGRYSFTDLHPGKWTVGFRSCARRANWAPQWYDRRSNAAEADPILLRPGVARTGIDAVLTPGAALSGQVVAAEGQPLAGICVAVGTPFELETGSASRTRTGASGHWYIGGFAAGAEQVAYSPGCGSKGDWGAVPDARHVRLRADRTMALPPFEMPAGGEIRGIVTDSTGAPLGGICVGTGTGLSGPSAVTQANGSYVVHNVAVGRTTVGFVPNCGNSPARNLLEQWWPSEDNPAAAVPVEVSAHQATAGLDAVLQPGGVVTGSLSGPTRAALRDAALVLLPDPGPYVSGLFVDAFVVNGSPPASVGPASVGPASVGPASVGPASVGPARGGAGGGQGSAADSFEVVGVPTGTYKLAALGGGFGVPILFHAGPGTAGSSPVTAVSVTAGTTTGGLRLAFSRTGSLSIAITTATRLSHRLVCISLVSGDGYRGVTEEVSLGQAGSYRLSGIGAGSYILGVSACAGGNLAPASTKVTVAAGQAARASLALGPGGTISGTVSSRGGPIPHACVELAAPGSAQLAAGGPPPGLVANALGQYRFNGLPAGSYEVVGSPCRPSKLAEAAYRRIIRLGRGATVAGIDLVLPLGGEIAGTITDPGGRPLAGICAVAVNVATGTGGYAASARNGAYRIGELATGQYAVQFMPTCGAAPLWAPQFYEGGSAPGQVVLVPVAGGQETSGIGTAMSQDGSISGTVSDTSGTGLSGICVVAVSGSEAGLAPVLSTSSAGDYVIGGLPAGSYEVGFASGCGGGSYLTGWYDGGRTQSQAAPVAVAPGSDTGGIGAVLSPAA